MRKIRLLTKRVDSLDLNIGWLQNLIMYDAVVRWLLIDSWIRLLLTTVGRIRWLDGQLDVYDGWMVANNSWLNKMISWMCMKVGWLLTTPGSVLCMMVGWLLTTARWKSWLDDCS